MRLQHVLAAVALVAAAGGGLTALIADESRGPVGTARNSGSSNTRDAGESASLIGSIELARNIAGGATPLVVDLRDSASYAALHVPSSIRMSAAELAEVRAVGRDIVLYAVTDDEALRARARLDPEVRANTQVLRGGLDEWFDRIVEPRLGVGASAAEQAAFDEAAALSRYFGGMPQSGVPADDVPQGYWTDSLQSAPAPVDARVRALRRRGC